MMAAEAEDGGSGQQWWWTRITATAADNSGGRQRRQTMMARKIRQQTTKGKEKSGRQTAMALDKRLISPPGREHEKINKLSLCKKTFFSNTVCLVGFFCSRQNSQCPLLDLTVLYDHDNVICKSWYYYPS
jgi:hypothetical protein